MATGRKLVSDVRSMHKLISTDASITDRAILSEVRNNTLLLVRRETNLRKLWATGTIFTTLPCLSMQEVPLSECADYVDHCMIAKSNIKLPSIAEGNYQHLIQGVYSINALGGTGTKLKEITVNRYMNLLQLSRRKPETYYMIIDGYVYVTNPDIQAIRFSGMFTENVSSDVLYKSCDCDDANIDATKYCLNPLDREFPLPGYLQKQVLSLTSQTLLGTYFSIKEDGSVNGVDEQGAGSNRKQPRRTN